MTLLARRSDSYRTYDRGRLLRMRANLLVTGPSQALDAFIADIRGDLSEPVVWTSADRSPMLQTASTLVVTAVDQLDDAGQRALKAWIDAPKNAATQVISLATMPLFPRVRRGQFDADLYYQLNTVYFDLQGR